MSSEPPPQSDLAKRLLAEEIGDGGIADTAVAAGRLYVRLSACLAPVIGGAGARALFARSGRLMKVAFPAVAAAIASTDEAERPERVAERLVACLAVLSPEDATAAAIALFTTLLHLVASFIGERLVTQIVASAFPTAGEAVAKEKE